MNNLILFLSHSLWISLSVAAIAYSLRDGVRDLRSYLASQKPQPRVFASGPVQARRNGLACPPARSFIFS